LDYDEPVTLLMPYEERRKLPLADAVLAAVHQVDRVKRVGATIVRENGDRIGHAIMVAIHDRPDFPRQQQP
jgi:hypothetical protein